MGKKRLDTTLESKSADFLVLAQLLKYKIAALKTYTNMPGYDIIAVLSSEDYHVTFENM